MNQVPFRSRPVPWLPGDLMAVMWIGLLR